MTCSSDASQASGFTFMLYDEIGDDRRFSLEMSWRESRGVTVVFLQRDE